MEAIFQPQNEPELIVFLSILEREKIPYFVHNGNFGSLYPGVQIPLFNVRKVMVPEKFVDEAKELLNEYLGQIEREPLSKRLPLSAKIRMLLELVVCSWFVPGSKKLKLD